MGVNKVIIYLLVFAFGSTVLAYAERGGDSRHRDFPFKVTSNTYSESQNNENACENEFGSSYHLASWSEIVNYNQTHGSLDSFLRHVGMNAVYGSEGGLTLHVSYNGQEIYSGNRHYFISRHDGNIPGNYLAHETLAHKKIALGSWKGSRKALCSADVKGGDNFNRKRHSAQNSDNDRHSKRESRKFPFKVTEQTYSESQRNEYSCKREFGNSYRLASWSDIVRYNQTRGSLDSFLRHIGMNAVYGAEGGRTLHVSYRGQEIYSGNRHYFISRHDGNIPGNYLAHETLADKTIALGSWKGSRNALCISED